MCFSPEASFAGGIIISSIGIATVRKVHQPSQLVFASIPLFFGIQQIAEGFLWISLPHPEYENIQKASTYFFLIMAQVLWPLMIPLSVLLMEKKNKQRKILKLLLGLGFALAMYYAFCLVSFNVNPQVMNYHIRYTTNFPYALRIGTFITYLFVTIVPLFVSSIKKTNLFGLLMFFSCVVTALFFRQYLTSVWCFFAALISVLIYWILSDSKREFIFLKNQANEFLNKKSFKRQ